jgi:hypothetical protein
MTWRTDLAAKCLRRAEARLREEPPRIDLASSLMQLARSLLRDDAETDDFVAAMRDGRVYDAPVRVWRETESGRATSLPEEQP